VLILTTYRFLEVEPHISNILEPLLNKSAYSKAKLTKKTTFPSHPNENHGLFQNYDFPSPYECTLIIIVWYGTSKLGGEWVPLPQWKVCTKYVPFK
jgi:hypothetical protein